MRTQLIGGKRREGKEGGCIEGGGGIGDRGGREQPWTLESFQSIIFFVCYNLLGHKK